MRMLRLLMKTIMGGSIIALMILLYQLDESKAVARGSLLILGIMALCLVLVELTDERDEVVEREDKEEGEAAVSEHQKDTRRRGSRRVKRSSRKRSTQKSRRK